MVLQSQQLQHEICTNIGIYTFICNSWQIVLRIRSLQANYIDCIRVWRLWERDLLYFSIWLLLQKHLFLTYALEVRLICQCFLANSFVSLLRFPRKFIYVVDHITLVQQLYHYKGYYFRRMSCCALYWGTEAYFVGGSFFITFLNIFVFL